MKRKIVNVIILFLVRLLLTLLSFLQITMCFCFLGIIATNVGITPAGMFCLITFFISSFLHSIVSSEKIPPITDYICGN
ncbi:putative membrane protein [Lachnospiraceae bacterium PF1-21]